MKNLLAALISTGEHSVPSSVTTTVTDSHSGVITFITILNFALSIAGFLGVLGMLPLTALGIYFFVKSSSEKDTVKKKSFIKKGIVFVVLPWILIVGSFIGYFLTNTFFVSL